MSKCWRLKQIVIPNDHLERNGRFLLNAKKVGDYMLTKADFSKSMKQQGKTMVVIVKFRGHPIYQTSKVMTVSQGLIAAEAAVSAILNGRNKAALMNINDILMKTEKEDMCKTVTL